MRRGKAPDLPTWLRAGLLAAALGAAACASPPAETPPTETPLELEFDGCLYVLEPVERPVCVLDEADPSLRLWVGSAPGAQVRVTAGSQQWDSAAAKNVQRGYFFELEDIDASEILVRAAGRRRTLRLARDRRPVFDVAGLVDEDFDRVLLEGVDDDELADFWERAAWEVDGPWGALALAVAARTQGAAGRRSTEINLYTVAHRLLHFELDRPEAAAKVLAALPEAPAGDGRSRFLTAFYRGSWAARTGRLANALLELRAASRQAERLGIEGALLAEQDLAHVLTRLGRYEQARALLERLRESAEDGRVAAGCPLADLFTDIGWSELLMLEAGLRIDPTPTFQRARRELASCDESAAQRTWNVEINLALAELAQGRFRTAREHLGKAEGLASEVWWSRSWQRESEARLALAEGDYPAAEKLFQELRKTPGARFNAGVHWRAAIGVARALEGQGRIPEALTAYAEAEERAFRASFSVPLSGSRSSRLYQRETLYYLELLVKLGRHDPARFEEALQVARRSLGRNLRRLELGSRLRDLTAERKLRWDGLVERYWSLTARIHRLIRQEEAAATDRARRLRERREQLEAEATEAFEQALGLLGDATSESTAAPRRPRAGELLLIYHPSRQGWIGFAYDDHGVRVAEIDADGLDVNAARLLVPFAEPLRRAERITVLPYGQLWQVNFHALTFDGLPLVKHAEVVYSLDLPRREAPASSASREALLAMDAGGDLAHAGAEVAKIEDLLVRAEEPWEVTITTMYRPKNAEGDVAELRSRLVRAPRIFHFAGHSQVLGWETASGLVLERRFGEDVRLTIRDILALEAVPELVVLSACESTLPVSPEEPSSLGVGHAFLLSGAREVVGASERIDDGAARAAMELFYEKLLATGSAAAALRDVQLAPGASEEWMKLRLVER